MINLQLSLQIVTYISRYICSKEETTNLQCYDFATISFFM